MFSSSFSNCKLWRVLLTQKPSRRHSCLYSQKSLYWVPAPPSLNPLAVLQAQGTSKKQNYTSKDPERALYLAWAPLAMVRGQSNLSSNLEGDIPSVPPEPVLQTLILAVECESALKLSSSTALPQFRINPAHPGASQ